MSEDQEDEDQVCKNCGPDLEIDEELEEELENQE